MFQRSAMQFRIAPLMIAGLNRIALSPKAGDEEAAPFIAVRWIIPQQTLALQDFCR